MLKEIIVGFFDGTTQKKQQKLGGEQLDQRPTIQAGESGTIGQAHIYNIQNFFATGSNVSMGNEDSNINIYQNKWDLVKREVDFEELLGDISQAIVSLKKEILEHEQERHDRDVAICAFLAAGEEAKRKNGPEILKHLDKLKSLPHYMITFIISVAGPMLAKLIMIQLGIGP